MAKSTKRTGPDDAALVRLLWNPGSAADPGRPGPKATLTLDAILEAGLALADDRSGPPLSMRLVADRLGCTPMALYTHVADKQELLRLMYDRAHAEFGAPRTSDPRASDVRRDVRAWTRAVATLYADHHWLSDVSWARPVLGPHEQGVLESLLERLAPLPLPPGRTGTLVSALFSLARTTGRTVADARHANRTSALSETEWWQRQSAAMAEAAPDFAERFPLSVRLGADGGGSEGDDDGAETEMVDPAAGYLENAAWSQLLRGVDLLLAGATAPSSAEEETDREAEDHRA